MTDEEAIKELRGSYELHQCEWAKRCLNTIEQSLENKDKRINELEKALIDDDYKHRKEK